MAETEPLPPAAGRNEAAGARDDAFALASLAAVAERGDPRWTARFAALLQRRIVRPLCGTGVGAAAFAGEYSLGLSAAPAARPRSLLAVGRRLAHLVGHGATVVLDLAACRLDPKELAGRLEAAVGEAFGDAGVRPLNLRFAVLPDARGRVLLEVLPTSRVLGYPDVLVRLPDHLLQAARREPGDRLWCRLTALSWRSPSIMLVLQGTQRPACELSAPEPVSGVLPLSLFEVPGGTAWLGLRFDISALPPQPDGSLPPALAGIARCAVRFADNLLDRLDWPTPGLRADARDHRRIALHLTGIGRAVDRCRLDPRRVETLRRCERWLAELQRVMQEESRQLAERRGPFPALRDADLTAVLAQRCGAEAAGHFVRQRATRNRHLVTATPFSVLPPVGSRYPAADYLNLLPALRHVSSMGLLDAHLRHRLGLDAWRRLLRMSWAIARPSG